MSKRNAHAVAARQRKAGAHREDYVFNCEECGRDMGFQPPSCVCAPCSLGIKTDEPEDEGSQPSGQPPSGQPLSRQPPSEGDD